MEETNFACLTDHSYCNRGTKKSKMSPEDHLFDSADTEQLKITSIDHSYCVPSQQVLAKRLQILTEKNKSIMLQLKREKRKLVLEKIKNQKLKLALVKLKRKSLLPPKSCNHLNALSTPTLKQIYQRLSNKRSNQSTEYPEDLKAFATTLQFYSTRAYEYVRKTFLGALPHITTIRKWFSNIHGAPGFSSLALQILNERVKEEQKKGSEIFVGLMLDDMSLRKEVDFDPKDKSFKGFVDLGEGTSDASEIPAKEVLVMMVVALNGHFKLPIGYFFIAGLNGAERANLVNIALIKIKDSGARCISFTCDGPSAHFAMIKELGANLSCNELTPFFPHPSNPEEKVHIFLDIAHMLKLIRNTLGTQRELVSPKGLVKWEYIERLYQLQTTEGLHAGNKLRRRHIEWERNKMKVCFAAQTLSESVAVAIDFARENLKMKEFEGSEPTTEFIRLFNAIFDLLNSKNCLARQYKAPISEKTENLWHPLFLEAIIYINQLKLKDGTPLLQSRLKTGFLGFVCGMVSTINLYEDVVKSGKMKFILTYKVSQDHLETFFAAIRGHLGANNNPSCKEFEALFKRFLVKQEISVKNGNALPQDRTGFLTISSTISKRKSADQINPDSLANLMDDCFEEANHLVNNLTDYKDSVVTYISGYVVKMARRKVTCEDCLESLYYSTTGTEKPSSFNLLLRKKWGRLIEASSDVIKVCFESEKLATKLLNENSTSFVQKKFAQKIKISVKKKLMQGNQ